MQRMPLTLLVVTMNHELPHKYNFASPSPDDSDDQITPFTIEEDMTVLDPARDYLDTMDVASYVELLARSVPTLEYVHIVWPEMMKRRDRRGPVWISYTHIIRTEGEITLQQLDDSEGERIFCAPFEQ